ncbi:OB-fold nucleic acid binding domain-containing protein, partial [Methanosaeta sp. UBA356]
MDGKEVMLAGFAHEIRDLGGIAFLVLRDREGMAQITLVKKLLGKDVFKMARSISRESVVMVRGNVKAEAKAPRGYEILPTEIQVLSAAQVPLPLDPTEKVECELDTRLDSRFMDIRRPCVLAAFEIESAVLFSLRDYFHRKGIVEVFT